jgi:hypothetical protein
MAVSGLASPRKNLKSIIPPMDLKVRKFVLLIVYLTASRAFEVL